MFGKFGPLQYMELCTLIAYGANICNVLVITINSHIIVTSGMILANVKVSGSQNSAVLRKIMKLNFLPKEICLWELYDSNSIRTHSTNFLQTSHHPQHTVTDILVYPLVGKTIGLSVGLFLGVTLATILIVAGLCFFQR